MPERYAAGVINYHSYDRVRQCVESLRSQTHPPEQIVIVDVDPLPTGRDRVPSSPDVRWTEMENRGFAGGANRALEVLRETREIPFVLVLNPDVSLEPDFAENLVTEMSERDRVGLATGKLLRADGTIDSAGIELPRNRRPRDRGSEEIDRGQYDEIELVFGASGAAMMMRNAALAELAIEGEVFDEDFFLYHEDTDLCWRAHLLGWQVLYVPQARARHERTWKRRQRFEIEPTIRRHSFKNHYLQIIKNEQSLDFWRNLPVLATWEILRLGFAVARDRAVLGGYFDAWRLARRAWHKRRVIQASIHLATRTDTVSRVGPVGSRRAYDRPGQ